MDSDALIEWMAKTSKSARSPHKKQHKYDTGTCFDTVLINTKEIPGGHPHVHIESELGAFSDYRPTEKPSPSRYLMSHTGTGGQRPFTPWEMKTLDDHKKWQYKLKGPKPAGAYHRRANPPNTDFRRYYDRGDIPVKVMHGIFRKVVWLKEFNDIDLFVILPLFFEGLREEEEPYKFLAYQGTLELLQHCEEDRIVPVIPQIVLPLKTALNTRINNVIVRCLRCMKVLVEKGNMVGESLVPYYRQLLPVLNIFSIMDRNLGDAIDYHQRCNDNIGVLIGEVLNLMEIYGGPDAFINIKYMVPTYESCLTNGD